MPRLDMTPYRPYRPMGSSCATRPIRDKQVVWVKPEPRTSPDGRFVVRPLERADIAAAAELWRQAYPEVYGSEHEFILFPEEYPAHFILADTWAQEARSKQWCMLVVQEAATGRLAAGSIMTKFDKNLQIEYTLAGTHPDYRRQGLMGLLGKVMHWLARHSGAEYLTTFLETWHTITQAETMKLGHGWKIAGIFPGNFTRWRGDNQEYRACEIYLYQFINDGDAYATKPEEWQLHPEIRRLWQCLESINARLLKTES
ncbi:MAG: GNAT family N-acetyltransferase [Deltaproteobacteria bacterium]|nr:GNAT family N-acetyltransferase [Deltaproteobacteria bacterium]